MSVFRCTKIAKYYSIVPLKRGNPSYKATFSLQKEWSYKRKTTVSSEQGKCIQVENKKLNSNAWQYNHNTLPPKT
jgi:hypothetical protein